MNRIYKVIWSKVKHQYVVVSELAHSCTKSAGSRVGRSAAAVLAALVLTTGLCAAPVQAEDLTDPYALLNAQVEETNSTSSDTLVTLVQSPLVKSVAPLANEDEGQPGEGGSSTVTTPDGQHTIYNEEGFYAHNGQGTYNSLTKDGLFVGGTDNGEGLYVDNDGNIYTDGNAEIEGSFSAANGSATIAADGSTIIQTGSSQLIVNGNGAGISSGNGSVSVSNNSATLSGAGNVVDAGLNGITLAERTGNTTVTVNQDGMTVDGDFAVTGNTNLKHTNVDGDLNVSGSTHVDGGLTAGNLQTDGKLTAGSAEITGDAVVGGKLTAGDVKTNTVDAHNVSVDNELTAGKATVEGTVRAGSFANTNGSFKVDTSGNVSANNVTALNEVSGMTFANTLNTFAVDADGNVKAADITSTGNVQATGDVKGATFSNTSDTFNVKADGDVVSKGDVSAVDVTASGALTGTTIANANNSFKVDTSGNVSANNVTALNEVSGMTFANTLNTFAVDADGNITGASVKVGDKIYISGTGLNANGQKITNVGDGNLVSGSKDAVNAGQLYDVKQSIKTYVDGDGITIAGDDNKISVNTGKGLEIADDKVQVKVNGSNLTLDDTNGLSLSTTLTGLTSIGTGSLTATGDVTADSFTVGGKTYVSSTGLNANGQKITNVADGDISSADSKDAVNGGQLYTALQGVKGTTYADGDGITITGADNKISVNTGKGLEIADDKVQVKVNGSNLTLDDTNGLSLSTTLTGLTSIGTGSLTATGDVTADSFTVGGKTYVSSTGLNANGQKITNVGDGNVVSGSKDAVNAGQLYDVKQSIKTYVDGDGITIAGDDNKISVNTGKGLEIADDKVQIKVNGSNLTLDEPNGLGLSTTLTGLESIETGTLKATGAVTAGSFSTTNGSATIGNIIINANNGGKITGLIGGVVNENSTEAINGGQLWKVQQDIQGISDLAVTYRNKDKQAVDLSYNNGNGTTITNVAAGDISKATSMDAVNGGQLYATNQIVGDGDYSSNNFLIDSTAAGGMNLTDAASALDKAIGTNRYTYGNILDVNADGKTYTSITDAVDTLNRSIGSLTFSKPQAYFKVGTHFNDVTSVLNELSGAIGPMQFDTTNNFIDNDSNLSSAIDKLDENIGSALKNVGFRTDISGKVTTEIDWTGSSYAGSNTTIISAVKDLDGRVTTLAGAANTLSTFSRSNISTLSALSNMDMSAVNTLSSLSADDLAAISTLSEDGSVPAANSDPNSRPGRGPSSGSEDSSTHDGESQTMDHDLNVTGDVSVGGTLDVTGEANFGSNVNVSGDLDVTGETNMHGTLNMNDNKITGVKDGDISADSTDAVNGSQLWQTNQQVAANTENIGILGSAVNKLGDRIERVGAGAAALAALHPLDFDPDNKLDFAAGFGNYRGASAVAVGAFYRPSENVMFSVGGAFGGGEDMVNAGVSFKVGAGSGSATTSRTAMAKSLKSMQEVVASQDAQLAQQREQIDKLTAMVELLMEQNGQAQPKDGDAQAAQPQQ